MPLPAASPRPISPQAPAARYTLCRHPRCQGSLAELEANLRREARWQGVHLQLDQAPTWCRGNCRSGPYLGLPEWDLFYAGVETGDASAIIRETALNRRLLFHRLHLMPTTVTDSRIIFDAADQVLVALEPDACLVELVTYLFDFNAAESCGKCFPCRLGVHQLHNLLHRLLDGGATEPDLEQIETLARMLARDTYCQFGPKVTAPLRLALELDRASFTAHLTGGCPPGVPRRLIPREQG